MKLTWRQSQWKYMFNENIKLAKSNFPITLDHFGQTFTCRAGGFLQSFKIYAINPKGLKWQIWARGLGGSEYKFTRGVLDYIGKEAPADLCGGQEYLPIQ